MSNRWTHRVCLALGLLLAACASNPGGVAGTGGGPGGSGGGSGGSGGGSGGGGSGGGGSGGSVLPPVVVTIYGIQDRSHPDWPGVDLSVIVDGVVVTAVEGDGSGNFFVQTPTTSSDYDATYGARYSGIFCFRDSGVILAVGDVVNIEGVYTEYPPTEPQTLSEIVITSVTVTGSGSVPPAEVLPAADIATAGSNNEPYEGVLVRVNNVALLNTDPNSNGDFGEFTVTGGLWIDDTLYNDADTIGRLAADFNYIQGPLHYDYSEFRVLPRDAGDIDVLAAGVKTSATISQLQDPLHASAIAPNTGVSIAGVVVTGIRPHSSGDGRGDFYIQTPAANYDPAYQNTATYGSPAAYSGILVSRRPNAVNTMVSVGDVVTVDGLFQEYFDNSVITLVGGGSTVTSVAVTGAGAGPVPAPAILTASTIASTCSTEPPADCDSHGPFAEMHEGVLVRVEGVTMVNKNPDATRCEDRGEFAVLETRTAPPELRVDDTLYYDAELDGRRAADFNFIQGPLDYNYGRYKLEPRNAADISILTPAPTTVATIYDLQDQVCSSMAIGSGEVVRVENVVVTGLRATSSSNPTGSGDFTVQIEEANYDTRGSSYSGIYISRAPSSTPAVHIGDVVSIEGLFTEYFNRSQIAPTTVTIVSPGTGAVPSMTVITDPASIANGGALAEQYEGVLVRVENAAVVSANPNSNGDFGEFSVTGDLWIDDTFFYDTDDIGRAALDFNFVQGPLDYAYNYFRMVPRMVTDIEVKTVAPATVATIYDLQDVAATNHPSEGRRVRIENVVVTGLRAGNTDGDFTAQIAEADYDATYGATFSGVYISRMPPAATDVSVGDIVTIEGRYQEYFTRTQITEPDVTLVAAGGGVVPTPVVLAPADIGTGGSLAETYEGVLVRVEGVGMSNANPDASLTPPEDHGEFEVGGALRVDDAFYYDAELIGRSASDFNFVQGPLDYAYGNSKLQPRDAADISANYPPATVHTIYEIQDPTVTTPAVDTRVRIENVVVTGLRAESGDRDFTVQIPTTGADYNATYATTYSGIYISRAPGAATVVAVGDVVSIEGMYEEYFNRSQINPTLVTIESAGTGDVPAPTLVLAAKIATSGTDGELYEGVLVRVEGVGMSNANPDAPGDFGEFEVGGALRVDDTFYYDAELTGRAATDFVFIQGVLDYAYSNFKLQPRDATDMDANLPAATLYTVYAIQNAAVTGPAVNTRVRVENVVVTGVRSSGGDFFAQMATGVATSGPAFSGIYIKRSAGSTPTVAVGDVVNVEGTYQEDFNNTVITASLVEYVSAATVPAAAVVVAGDIVTGGIAAEDFEGVLVQVNGPGLNRTAVNPDSAGDFGEFAVTGGLRVDDMLFWNAELVGRAVTNYNFIVGPLLYAFSNSKIEPRDAADIGFDDTGATPASIYDIQNPASAAPVAEGTLVRISSVVVTAVAGTGTADFYVQVAGADQDGTLLSRFSGIACSRRANAVNQVVAVADQVDVVGVYAEDFGNSMVVVTSVAVTGAGLLPAATIVNPADIATSGILGEDYEGVFTRVEVVALVTANPDLPDDFGEFTITGGLRIGDHLYADAEITGRGMTSFSFIQGIVGYSFSDFKLWPRNVNDIQ